jgi:hypothetical protein
MNIGIKLLENALKRAWSRETCYLPDQEKWSSQNPAFGQCAVTALIVQDFFGGEILRCVHYRHYWNRLPNGEEIDLTRSQFGDGVKPCADKVVPRKRILESESAKKAKTKERYLLLRSRVDEILQGLKNEISINSKNKGRKRSWQE